MDSQDSLLANTENKERKAIGTFGLGGCTGIAVSIENENGTEKLGIVGHYSPIGVHMGAPKRFEMLIQGAANKGNKVVAVILTPGEWHKDAATGKYEQKPKDQELEQIEKYKQMILQTFPTAEINVIGYSEAKTFGATEEGTLLVEYPANNAPTKIYIEGIPLKHS